MQQNKDWNITYLNLVSNQIMIEGIEESKLNSEEEEDYPIKTNKFNEQINDYETKFFERTNCNICLIDNKIGRNCFCPNCMLKKLINLNILNNKIKFKNTFVEPVYDVNFNVVVKNRDGRYYLLAKSNVKNFNTFIPLSEIFDSFY